MGSRCPRKGVLGVTDRACRSGHPKKHNDFNIIESRPVARLLHIKGPRPQETEEDIMKGGGINRSQSVGNDPVKLAQAWFNEVKAGSKPGASSASRASGVDEQAARKAVSFNSGFAGASRFAGTAPDFSLEGRIAARISDGVPSDAECHFLALACSRLPKEKVAAVIENLVDRGAKIVSHNRFRGLLDRDGNLAVNQAIRQANNSLAYNTVDFDIDGMRDEEFWARIDASPNSDLIKKNAVEAMLNMAGKLGITDELKNA